MELYIEKEFLDNFYLDYNEFSASSSQKIVAKILREYAEIDWFINCEIESKEQHEHLKAENPFFKARSAYKGPKPVKLIREHFFENSDCKQTLIFTQNLENWFVDAESKGAMCFSFDNYETKIQTIITSCHNKIDLSSQFQGWRTSFNRVNILPFNKIIINDSYILVDSGNQKMDDNIIKLLKSILTKKEKNNIAIQIYTDQLINTRQNEKKPTESEIKDSAKKKKCKLNSSFANYNTCFEIISNSIHKRNPNLDFEDKIDFHDRLIYSNFFIVDCTKGFNLMPHRNSNSQIIFETIFDIYTYNRLKKHMEMHDDYFKEIKKSDPSKFTYI